MEKNVIISLALLFVTVAVTSVAAFGEENQIPQFGAGSYYDRKFQNWLFKRGLGFGGPAYGGFGAPLTDPDSRFFNWRDFLNSDGISKRQLSYGSGRFGNFRRYFTDGLQDWRSNYISRMKKREATHKDQ